METDGSYTCGEHSIMNKLVKSLCCISEINATLCINYTKKNSMAKEAKLYKGEKSFQ